MTEEELKITITKAKLKAALKTGFNKDTIFTDGRVNEIWEALKKYRKGRPPVAADRQ